MNLWAAGLGLMLAVSVFVNVYLLKRLERLKARRASTPEMQELVADIMHGKLGMVAVARIDPNDLLMKSPRQSR